MNLESYIKNLIKLQNKGASLDQMNLYSEKDYYLLLKPVLNIIKSNPDFTLEEYRKEIFKNSKIEEKVRDFVYKRETIPGMVFSYGTKHHQETVIVGNRQEVSLDENGRLVPNIESMTDDTIIDLASVTKLFTSLSIMKLLERGEISLEDEVAQYAREFKNLKGVTIFDLLSFRIPLKTSSRVDKASSKEEAESILFDIEVDKENANTRPYTDMGAMVLKYVIESVSGQDYYSFLDNEILKPLNLVDTHVVVPEYKLDRVASSNFSGSFYKDGNIIINMNSEKGKVYDPKAKIMGQTEGILSGHAGLFSTAKDMTKLAKGIMGGQIINDKYVEMMAKNRTGRMYKDENGSDKVVQYLGFLCYSKCPRLSETEVFHALSGRALASAGWTGSQLTIDPVNELYLYLFGNKAHNRMIFIDPSQRDKVITEQSGKKYIYLPDGQMKIDSSRYAWDRDEIVRASLSLALQYKFLEDIFANEIDYDSHTESQIKL